VHAVKIYCVIAKPGRSAWTRFPKWKAIIMGSDGPHGTYGKKASNRQILIVGYLQFEGRERAPAHSTVFNWVRSFSSCNEIAQGVVLQSVKNGSLKPF